MKRLPHEKLREAAKTEADERNYYPCVVAAKDFGAMDDTRYTTEVKLLNAIANEIEKYYIPRPRFDDGEPVQRYDKVDWENYEDCHPQSPWIITAIRYDGRPIATAGDKVVAVAKISDDGFIKRPKPKVLDADGVEIKVGDTVWGKYSGVEHEVIGFDSCDGLLCVSIRNVETGSTGGSSPNLLTHREPDSLEKLLVDLRGAADFIPSKEYLKHLADRLTAIMERDA